MILVVCALFVVATVPMTGGNLRHMADMQLAHLWTVWAAIGVQTMLVSAPWNTPHDVAQALHLLSYIIAGTFAWTNRRAHGVPLIAVGGALNATAIFANNGVMPASRSALVTAGIPNDDTFTNSGFVTDAHVAWLGDIFAIPASWPLSNVFSIGDIIIVIGIAYMAHRQCRSTPVRTSNEPEPPANARSQAHQAESTPPDEHPPHDSRMILPEQV
jgi:hypothetical protein